MTSKNINLAKTKEIQAKNEVNFLLKNLIVEFRTGELPTSVLIHNYTIEIVKLMETFFPNRFSAD